MQTRNLIDGQWVDADSGATMPVFDPADDSLIAEVPKCGLEEASRSVAAAARRFDGFQSTTPGERVALLRDISRIMADRRDPLAELLTREQGKPLFESRGEVDYARSYLDGAAHELERRSLETRLDPALTGKSVLVHSAPLGVAAIITPWNFPYAMLTKKLGPAFATGCPVVAKPSEETPLSALALAEICVEAGLPSGCFSVVTGDPVPIGEAFFDSQDVRLLSFTGSTATGRKLVRSSSSRLTRLALELGGHAPFIVLEDADIDSAVEGLMISKFRNSGQTCVSPNRIMGHHSLHDPLVSRLAERMKTLVSGRGLDPATNLGPMINDAGIRKVQSHVEDALSRGARLLMGGELRHVEGLSSRFYAPTILLDATPEMLCFQEETFGPVCPIMSFEDVGEAIQIANELPYGLASYVWSSDADRAMFVASRLHTGIVGINDPSPVTSWTPFGGRKQSGWGIEGGAAALDEYAPPKTYSIVGLQDA
ncbi:MAG: succinate-semialdehyde dehydrogenase (NADP(+)) [Phycisphaerae bacterium]|nr:succinate-semialdehyde dehydrogenase (NADP(+)) [Phycisphaerae bacterium]